MMGLREESLDVLKSEVASPGAAVVYMGSSGDWHRFFFSYERKYNDAISRGHGEFRCKGLKLMSTKGEVAVADLPCMARVMAVDPERRTVMIDIEGAKEDLRRALEATEREWSNKPLQGTSAEAPPSNPSQGGCRPSSVIVPQKP